MRSLCYRSGILKVKKVVIALGLIVGLFLGSFNICRANDVEKVKLISEIGMLTNTKNYEQALEKCNAALKKYPNTAELYYWSATIKVSKGEKASALHDYDKAVSLNPKDHNIYVMRGICKSDLGDSKGAIEDYDKALQLDPNDSSAYSMRACEKINLGDLEGANTDLNKANSILLLHK